MLYIVKSPQGFIVKELQSGRSSVPFSWQIVANRKDDTGYNGLKPSVYASLRFPDAPQPMEIKAGVAQDIKAENEITPKLSSTE